MLNRDVMLSGNFLQFHKETLDGEACWSADMLKKSMEDFLQKRPTGAPVWLFAYGSLMWNPTIAIEEIQRAHVEGWQRRFCIRLQMGRATKECPGRMLSLDKGGATEGLLFRLPNECLEKELSIVWMREMLTGLYQPTWVDAMTSSGEKVKALAFTSNQEHVCYEADNSVNTVAKLISHACGELGSNSEYVLRLNATLHSWGIIDHYISSVAEQIQEHVSPSLL